MTEETPTLQSNHQNLTDRRWNPPENLSKRLETEKTPPVFLLDTDGKTRQAYLLGKYLADGLVKTDEP